MDYFGCEASLLADAPSTAPAGRSPFPAFAGKDGEGENHINAWMPVCARPRISAWMSWVPS